ncbi:unnamed protein product [Onchocerca ochengi]|uniref:OCRE domain-containing protein n=1 Tax=Onchocerca ochengi TaxID=42157 RepID=A0A182EDZ4_ONCOC|nr:unnamed protein product [Onchocerca ochengi]
MKDSHRIQKNDGNEMICIEENITQKNPTDELEFITEEGYNIGANDNSEIAHEEPDFTEYGTLATKDCGEIAVDETCLHSGIREGENFGGEKFDVIEQDTKENQSSDGNSTGNVEEAVHDSSETAETRSIYNGGKTHSQGSKHYIPPGWVYHGESDGYRYYIGCAGEMYSVDRDGYWYMQDNSGNFIPYTGYQYNRGAHSSLFPRDSQGRFILPTNACGEKAFPVDANNMPIFPFDTTTHLPTFPVDENGQPVFPTGVLGRPIVPVDTNGLAIFPRDANGRFIFPSGPDGRPTAPINIYGVPVMPLDEQGKPVVPYDASGTPLIHLASDGSFVIRVSLFFIMKDFSLCLSFSVYGMTPLTEEEYQYSLQWNDYYSRYYKNTAEQKASNSSQSMAQSTASNDTYEQKAKNMKLLKKVRPEDIDLPPCVPPPPSTQPPLQVSDGPTLSGEVEKKATLDPALKAKTKKMIEMQLKFSRKKLHETVHSSVAAVPSSETINKSAKYAPLPQQPNDSPENAGKLESPKEFPSPPPSPMHALISNASISTERDSNIVIRESLNGDTSKSLDSKIMEKLKRNSSDDSEVKGQATILQAELTPVILDVSNNVVKTSGDIAENFESPKLTSNICKNLNEFQVDNQVFGKEVSAKLNDFSGSKDGKVQPELILTEEEKVARKTRSSVGNSYESNIENEILGKHDDKDEHILVSHEKHSEKKMRHHDRLKNRRKRRSESGHRRSRSRSSYRDSHRRSRSRGTKHRSRTRSRTPRDYYYRSRYRSRSRDRFSRHESSHYDRRSYRRYSKPDSEDKYSYRRRHSSSRDKSSQHERSTSRDRSPSADKSSRSRSYYDRSKSRSESLVVSRQSSVERSVSQCKTSDSRNRSSSRRNSPEYDISQITEQESEKSSHQLVEDLTSIDGTVVMHKSARHSTTPRSEKSSVREFEVKTAKSKKHKKTKEKHRKRKKSHHKKRDKKKSSPFMAESEAEEKFKTSSILSEETDLNLNTSLSHLADEEAEIISNTKKQTNDYKSDRTKKKKEKKRKKERRNTDTEKSDVMKKASHETLEDGELITEKDVSPKMREIMVNYATSESEAEDNITVESKSSAEQLSENYNKICLQKGVSSMTNFAVNSKAAESSAKFKENSNDADIRSTVLSFDLIDEVLKVPSDNTNTSKLEKRETKITVDLEDDGISSKLKDLTSDFNEITAREAEKLKADNITEAMNKLKELRGYIKSKVTVSNSATETEDIKQFNKANVYDSTFAGHSLADVPLPKGVQMTVDVTERAEKTAVPGIRTQEACTSAKIDLVDRDVRRKKELLKRKWEEDEEDELSRLRYEALRSKTRRLMNDLRAERRRLKRERLRAAIAMRRARERSVDTSVDEILLVDTSDSSETDDSEDYSPSRKVDFLSDYHISMRAKY